MSNENSDDERLMAHKHHSTLNAFAIVQTILENGHLYDPEANDSAQEIIAICQDERTAQLSMFDAAMAQQSRERVLLRAAFDMLGKMDILRMDPDHTAFYDGTHCDGICLRDDIAACLDIDPATPPMEGDNNGN